MNKFFIFLIVTILYSCANGDEQSKMIHWYEDLEYGTTIKEVQLLQPNFVEIDWASPDSIFDIEGNLFRTRYYMNVNNSDDILNMSYYLEFENDSLISGFAHK